MSRFVKAGTRVLRLANGDTLVVKERLNQGEEIEMYQRTGGDRARLKMCTVVAHLLDWQLKDDQMPILTLSDADKERVLGNLDPDDFDEIQQAIYEHIGTVQKERSAAKKVRDGVSGSSATSPSPGTTAGATSGSNT